MEEQQNPVVNKGPAGPKSSPPPIGVPTLPKFTGAPPPIRRATRPLTKTGGPWPIGPGQMNNMVRPLGIPGSALASPRRVRPPGAPGMHLPPNVQSPPLLKQRSASIDNSITIRNGNELLSPPESNTRQIARSAHVSPVGSLTRESAVTPPIRPISPPQQVFPDEVTDNSNTEAATVEDIPAAIAPTTPAEEPHALEEPSQPGEPRQKETEVIAELPNNTAGIEEPPPPLKSPDTVKIEEVPLPEEKDELSAPPTPTPAPQELSENKVNTFSEKEDNAVVKAEEASGADIPPPILLATETTPTPEEVSTTSDAQNETKAITDSERKEEEVTDSERKEEEEPLKQIVEVKEVITTHDDEESESSSSVGDVQHEDEMTSSSGGGKEDRPEIDVLDAPVSPVPEIAVTHATEEGRDDHAHSLHDETHYNQNETSETSETSSEQVGKGFAHGSSDSSKRNEVGCIPLKLHQEIQVSLTIDSPHSTSSGDWSVTVAEVILPAAHAALPPRSSTETTRTRLCRIDIAEVLIPEYAPQTATVRSCQLQQSGEESSSRHGKLSSKGALKPMAEFYIISDQQQNLSTRGGSDVAVAATSIGVQDVSQKYTSATTTTEKSSAITSLLHKSSAEEGKVGVVSGIVPCSATYFSFAETAGLHHNHVSRNPPVVFQSLLAPLESSPSPHFASDALMHHTSPVSQESADIHHQTRYKGPITTSTSTTIDVGNEVFNSFVYGGSTTETYAATGHLGSHSPLLSQPMLESAVESSTFSNPVPVSTTINDNGLKSTSYYVSYESPMPVSATYGTTSSSEEDIHTHVTHPFVASSLHKFQPGDMISTTYQQESTIQTKQPPVSREIHPAITTLAALAGSPPPLGAFSGNSSPPLISSFKESTQHYSESRPSISGHHYQQQQQQAGVYRYAPMSPSHNNNATTTTILNVPTSPQAVMSGNYYGAFSPMHQTTTSRTLAVPPMDNVGSTLTPVPAEWKGGKRGLLQIPLGSVSASPRFMPINETSGGMALDSRKHGTTSSRRPAGHHNHNHHQGAVKHSRSSASPTTTVTLPSPVATYAVSPRNFAVANSSISGVALSPLAQHKYSSSGHLSGQNKSGFSYSHQQSQQPIQSHQRQVCCNC